MYSFQTLKTRADGAVLFVEIDSPPMNLLGKAMVADLVSLIRILDKGEQHRVVVFSSAHPDFFIPHVDVTEVAAYREVAASLTGKASLGLLFRRLSETKAITIAQIAGRVRGAGSEFALACDMRFASRERAIFGQIECGLGLVPGAGAVQHLARALGRGRALEVLLSSNDYDAETAERYGWINRALPNLELASFVAALARRISQFPHEGLIGIKDRVNAVTLASEPEFLVDSDLFGAGVKLPVTQARMRTLFKRGMQKPEDLELNFGRALGELAD
jgi:enoyl-CoA hydratase/carnithine racemase